MTRPYGTNGSLGTFVTSYLAEHEKAGRFVSFHKLSQWLTYSLLEPLQNAGLKITDLQLMTGSLGFTVTIFTASLEVYGFMSSDTKMLVGLPEYRNGGLLVDFGVLVPKSSSTLTDEFNPSAEMIIEWRALTVALLDELHTVILERLNFTAEIFPLVKVNSCMLSHVALSSGDSLSVCLM